MLVCDKCKGANYTAIDSRNDGVKGSYIKRRRKCLDCGYRFTTVEISKDEYLKLKERAEQADRIAEIATIIMGDEE